MFSSLCLSLALVGQCPGGRCPARVYYRPAAPAVATVPPAAPVVRPAAAPTYPLAPLPNGYRYIWNGYAWVPSPY